MASTLRTAQGHHHNAPFDKDLVNDLRAERGIDMVPAGPASGISLGAILMNFLPVLLIIGFWHVHHAPDAGRRGGRGAMSFGKLARQAARRGPDQDHLRRRGRRG
jgi:cell division protease FtsH